MHLLSPSLPTNLIHLIRRLLHVLSTVSKSSTTAFAALESQRDFKSSDNREANGAAVAQSATAATGGEPTPPAEEQEPKSEKQSRRPRRNSPLDDLLANAALFSPLRKPRFPIVLCHGLYGFDVRGPTSFPSLQLHYWSSVLDVLRDKVGAEVIITGVSA
jgi:hypothetical protein